MAAMNALQKMQLDLNTETKSKTETPPTENHASSNGETDEQHQRTSLLYFPAASDEEESKEALPGGESGNIGTSLNGENKEKITGKIDSNTKEEEFSTAVKQTVAGIIKPGNQKKEEQIVLGELLVSPGRTKLNPGKDPTSKRNEMISSISPKGEKNKNKRQLNQLLKSNPGGHASSEFHWDTGILENELPKKRGMKSSSNRSSVSKFRDGRISAGNWVHKDFVSRDGQMKLGTHVYFALIDQRNESAGGASACTVLVVIIANCFQTNHDSMPTVEHDSQFDSLIREGSLEWRKLCEKETIKKRFPVKHLDLGTVLQANIWPISISVEKSFVGFFLPDGMKVGDFDLFVNAMLFDDIWDKISSCAEKNCISGGGPQVYIVSWKDHFFILKVEAEAYYLMDTFGERLYEGCDRAYFLKFDKDTTIHSLYEVVKKTETVDQLIMAEPEKETDTVPQLKLKEESEDLIVNVESGKKEDILCTRKEYGKQGAIVCTGKESCKEYIKSFVAAITLNEIPIRIKEGKMETKYLVKRLQIDFQCIEYLLPNT